MTYLNIEELASGMERLASTYPDLVDLIRLPNVSVEGRDIRALALGDARGTAYATAIFVGGLHAREWVPPDALLYLAADLLEARARETGLRYGDAAFSADDIAQIFRKLQLVIVPCANPDGRAYSQTQDPLWRKNRSTNLLPDGRSCRGVDLNRNFDVAWDFRRTFAPDAVSASDDPCHPALYVGPEAASEPETRNIIWLLDTYAEVRWFLDVHSAIPAVFHGWGLDENQTVDAEMNHANPRYDGKRGIPGDPYREYISAEDLEEAARLTHLMAEAMGRVRGDQYEVGPAFSLYATSGASDDYAFSRHLIDPSKPKVLGFTIECGHDFQPDWIEAEAVIREVGAALTAFALDRAYVRPLRALNRAS
jgi:murein tripeptide amidase MpaA